MKADDKVKKIIKRNTPVVPSFQFCWLELVSWVTIFVFSVSHQCHHTTHCSDYSALIQLDSSAISS